VKNTALLIACLALAGCKHEELGPTLTEPGVVVDLPYVPSGHGSGMGVSMKGSAVISSVEIPARYAIVFECQHGRFVIEGRPDIWERLHVGQAVTIRYAEVFEVDGESRRVVDLHFIDAT